jgi:hypothetical protein
MIYLFLLLLLTGCTHHLYQDAAVQLREGHFNEAADHLVKADLPYRDCNESTLLLLSRAMVYFQSGNTKETLSDFEKALDALDYYKQKVAHEVVGQTLLQDDIAAYVPPPYEEQLARFYQALAFLDAGDEANAAASVYYLENHDHKNPLTTYLLATLFQRRGDHSNARILYSRLGHENVDGNVLIVHHRGILPQKKSEIAPCSVVSTVLLEALLAAHKVEPALSTLVGVPVPVFEESHLPHSRLSINTQSLTPKVCYDIAATADDHLQKEIPVIATRAAARLLIRRAAVASTKKEYQPLMDIAMLVSNAATQADTRSWNMLPSSIDLYHLTLEPGLHKLQLNGKEFTVTVKSKELAVVEIFQPTHKTINLQQKERT